MRFFSILTILRNTTSPGHPKRTLFPDPIKPPLCRVFPPSPSYPHYNSHAPSCTRHPCPCHMVFPPDIRRFTPSLVILFLTAPLTVFTPSPSPNVFHTSSAINFYRPSTLFRSSPIPLSRLPRGNKFPRPSRFVRLLRIFSPSNDRQNRPAGWNVHPTRWSGRCTRKR